MADNLEQLTKANERYIKQIIDLESRIVLLNKKIELYETLLQNKKNKDLVEMIWNSTPSAKDIKLREIVRDHLVRNL